MRKNPAKLFHIISRLAKTREEIEKPLSWISRQENNVSTNLELKQTNIYKYLVLKANEKKTYLSTKK